MEHASVSGFKRKAAGPSSGSVPKRRAVVGDAAMTAAGRADRRATGGAGPGTSKATEAYWETWYRGRGEFQWGGVLPSALAKLVRAELDARGASSPARILVAGAGTSLDAAALKDALGLPASAVIAADFVQSNVHWQNAAGVTGVKADLLTVREDWVAAFDVVVDAAFTDVWASVWSGSEHASSRMKVTPDGKRALRNIFSYLRPGGLFVVKSMICSQEQYAALFRAAMGKGSKLEYEPPTALDSTQMAATMPPDFATTTKSGRRVKPRPCEGHVGLMWTPEA